MPTRHIQNRVAVVKQSRDYKSWTKSFTSRSRLSYTIEDDWGCIWKRVTFALIIEVNLEIQWGLAYAFARVLSGRRDYGQRSRLSSKSRMEQQEFNISRQYCVAVSSWWLRRWLLPVCLRWIEVEIFLNLTSDLLWLWYIVQCSICI